MKGRSQWRLVLDQIVNTDYMLPKLTESSSTRSVSNKKQSINKDDVSNACVATLSV